MALRASIVVPTFRRPESLGRCLAALCAQDFDPAAYEVIVVDDAASDEARRVVTCYAERVALRGLALRYVPVTGTHGPAAARNAGWRAARGPTRPLRHPQTRPRLPRASPESAGNRRR